MENTKPRRGRAKLPENEKSRILSTSLRGEVIKELADAHGGSGSTGLRIAAERYFKFLSLKNKGK